MCGIAALISPDKAAGLAPSIQAMCDVIRHRGPDDEGYAFFSNDVPPFFAGGNDTPDHVYQAGLAYAPSQPVGAAQAPGGMHVALGHRRLSIVDLSASGHQPMCDTSRRYHIVYNGEIYNHLELREELEKEGYSFHSRCDTEVILHAYAAWGEACLKRFNGMFAFVIYDTQRKHVFAARDRFGIKPCYFWRRPDGVLAIASEIKQFTVLDGWNPTLNAQRAGDFLCHSLSDHSADTFFETVHQLPPGHYLSKGLDDLGYHVPTVEWYRLADKPAQHAMGFEESTLEFRRLFDDSIRLRLRADVPVGTGLSGGMDSSSIVCSANQLLRAQGGDVHQHTFSACSEHKAFDEKHYIDMVVNHTDVDAQYVYPDISTLREQLPTMLWHQDEPFQSTSIYAEWNVFKLVSGTDVKVTLEGHGADEALIGYHTFFAPYLAELVLRGKWMTFQREAKAIRRMHGVNALKETMKALVRFVLPHQQTQQLRTYIGIDAARVDWIESERFGIQTETPIATQKRANASLHTLSRQQLQVTSLPRQLHWADRDSMAYSIEARVPFLDHRVVEHAYASPSSHKLYHGVTKRMLREAMRDVLPEGIYSRRDKIGFATAEEVWVREHDSENFLADATRAVEQSQGLLNESAIERAKSIIHGKGAYDPFLWRMICFGAWMDRFSVKAR